MDEFEVVELQEMRTGSLHVRHEVHGHRRVDADHQQGKNQHHYAHDGSRAAERLQRGMGGWVIQHRGGIPCFVRKHSCPRGL